MAARRWLLFGLSLASLLAMTYAGVSLAFSVKVTPEMADADGEAKLGARMLVRVLAGPDDVHTLADGTEADLLAMGDAPATFIANARNVSIGRALAYVAPDANGSYAPAEVRARDGTDVNVTALAAGGTGYLVQAENEEPRFVPADRVLGKVERFENATLLPGLFMAGLVGFVAPLIVIVATHKGAGRPGPRTGVICRECRAPMATNATFCMRCGAYVKEG